MSETSPTQRSLKSLREAGWTVAKVEYWNSFCKRRVDVWKFGDLLACKPNERPTLIQTTSGDNVSHRIQKAKENAGPLVAWLLSGGRLVVHGWAKRGGRGEAKHWTLREVNLSVADLTEGLLRRVERGADGLHPS